MSRTYVLRARRYTPRWLAAALIGTPLDRLVGRREPLIRVNVRVETAIASIERLREGLNRAAATMKKETP